MYYLFRGSNQLHLYHGSILPNALLTSTSNDNGQRYKHAVRAWHKGTGYRNENTRVKPRDSRLARERKGIMNERQRTKAETMENKTKKMCDRNQKMDKR